MTVAFRPLFHPFHPYRVDWPDLYYANGPDRYSGDPSETRYFIRNVAAEWLDQQSGVKYKNVSGPVYFAPEATDGKFSSVWWPDPPPVWFARKSDALLMKLVLTGQLV